MDSISPAEWSVLRIIWTEKHVTARRLIALVSSQHAWSASTVKTLLARLRTKGYVRTLRSDATTSQSPRAWVYEATMSESSVINAQTSDFFSHICAMHQGPALIHLAQTVPLSQKNIRDLQKILEKRAASAPLSVPCDCECGCAQTAETGTNEATQTDDVTSHA
jgi:CopY/TcrY family copper transport repressor